MHKHLLSFVGIVAMAACGGGGGVSAEDYPDALADARCKNLVACEGQPDSSTCADSLVFAGNDLETILADIASGKVKYDESQAKKCLDEVKAAGCSFDGFQNGTDSACNHVFTGTVAMGGACFTDVECAGGASCAQTDQNCDPSTACCAGTCGAPEPAPVAIGGACSDSSGCQGAAFCKAPASGSGMGTCTALLTTEGAPCEDLDACVDPMYCDLDFQTFMGVCTKAAASGATCDNSTLLPCADGRDYCDATTMKCVRAADVGAACPDGVDCVGYAACVNGTCVAKPGLGGTCVVDQDPSCLGTLECTGGKCTVPATGTACM